MSNERYLNLPINWEATGNPLYPYKVQIDGKEWFIRLNDFPEEPHYTLLIDNLEMFNFDDWPVDWIRKR